MHNTNTHHDRHHVAGPRRCCERDGVVPRKKQSCHASFTSSRQRRMRSSWNLSWSARSRSADSRCFSLCLRAASTAASETDAVKPRGGAGRPKASSGGQRGSASAGAEPVATAAAASRATAVRRGAASSALAQPESKIAARAVQRCRAQPGRALCRRLARAALLQGCMTAVSTTLRGDVRGHRGWLVASQ